MSAPGEDRGSEGRSKRGATEYFLLLPPLLFVERRELVVSWIGKIEDEYRSCSRENLFNFAHELLKLLHNVVMRGNHGATNPIKHSDAELEGNAHIAVNEERCKHCGHARKIESHDSLSLSNPHCLLIPRGAVSTLQ